MKTSYRLGFGATTKWVWWTLLLGVLPLVLGCQTAPAAPAAKSPAESWSCRNDVEISCADGGCAVGDSFTPMDVTVHGAGGMRVCAYSGCWAGTGTVTRNGDFVVVSGADLPFSTAPEDADSGQDIVIVIDRGDLVGLLKAGSFALPLICRKITDQAQFDYDSDQ